MNFLLFVIVLFGLQLICFYFGSKSSGNLKTEEDYFLAGRSVSFFPLLMTFIATQIGGGLILGSAEEAYRYGWSVIFYPLGACLGFLLLAMGIGKKLASFKVSTVAQLFEVVYQSVFLKKTASLLSIVSLFMILVAQFIASKKFMVGLGSESDLLFISFWAIVIAYTVLGGLRAVVATDVIQASFFILIFSLCFVWAIFSPDFSNISFFAGENLLNSVAAGQSKIWGWVLMPLFFMIIEQDMAQRCFAADSSRSVSRAAFYSALAVFVISLIPIFFGVLAKELGIEVESGTVFMAIISKTTGPWITALVGCAVLAAIISTADSLMNAISSNLSQDFSIQFNKRGVKSAQIVTGAISILAIIFSYYFDNIVDLLIQSYELSVYCLCVPVVAALFKKNGNSQSAMGAILFGAIGFFLFRYLETPLPKEISALTFSLVGFFVGEILARKSIKSVSEIRS